jgi:hypothetical protein
MIKNNRGATLPQVLVITSIVGALSVAIMQSVNLANRLKAQNDAVLTMDKITSDLTEKLADPEVCGVRYEALAPDTIRGITNYRHGAGSTIGNFVNVNLSSITGGSGRVPVAQDGIANVDNPSEYVYAAIGKNIAATDVKRKDKTSGFVTIKEFYFENFSTNGDVLDNGEISGNVDLRVMFYKRRQTGIEMFGGAVGSRVIPLRVQLDSSSRIKKCYANSGEVTFEGTKKMCDEVGGSFSAGKCFYSLDEKTRILRQLCNEMYGEAANAFDAAGNCNHPDTGATCPNGIRGFDNNGRILCQ